MTPLAHAGEEILIPLIPALIFLFVYRFRARRNSDGQDADGPPRCPYCGAHLDSGAERCERCGFRIAR